MEVYRRLRSLNNAPASRWGRLRSPSASSPRRSDEAVEGSPFQARGRRVRTVESLTGSYRALPVGKGPSPTIHGHVCSVTTPPPCLAGGQGQAGASQRVRSRGVGHRPDGLLPARNKKMDSTALAASSTPRPEVRPLPRPGDPLRHPCHAAGCQPRGIQDILVIAPNHMRHRRRAPLRKVQ